LCLLLDFWYNVVHQGKKERKAKKKEKKKAEKAEDVKAGADVGKIVNLMAGDANKVCHVSQSGDVCIENSYNN
jgi:hypothetical protein